MTNDEIAKAAGLHDLSGLATAIHFAEVLNRAITLAKQDSRTATLDEATMRFEVAARILDTLRDSLNAAAMRAAGQALQEMKGAAT